MDEGGGICPSCGRGGVVGGPCGEPVCGRRGYRFIPPESAARLRSRGPDDHDPLVGRAIAEWLVVDRIGAGGFGKVYLALQMPILMPAALKLMDRAEADPAALAALEAKFRLEAKALACLSHPNVVRLLQYGSHGGQPYLVMEYVRGRTLRAAMGAAPGAGALPPEAAPHVLRQVLRAMDAAHRINVVHRDMKPDNVMLQDLPDDPFFVRVLDFGLAKFVEERSETSMMVGTPAYMAPEQLSRRDIGPWTDLYAVGVIAFELMTGRRPFPGRSTQEVLAKKIDPAYDPTTCLAGLDPTGAATAFFRRALAREPGERFRTAQALGEGMEDAWLALAAGARGATVALPPPTEPVAAPRSRRLIGGVVAAVAVCTGAGGAWLALRGEKAIAPTTGPDTLARVAAVDPAPALAAVVAPAAAPPPVATAPAPAALGPGPTASPVRAPAAAPPASAPARRPAKVPIGGARDPQAAAPPVPAPAEGRPDPAPGGGDGTDLLDRADAAIDSGALAEADRLLRQCSGAGCALSLKRLALGWSAKGERAKALETWWRLWRSTSDAFQKEQIRKQIDALGGTVEGGESRSRE